MRVANLSFFACPVILLVAACAGSRNALTDSTPPSGDTGAGRDAGTHSDAVSPKPDAGPSQLTNTVQCAARALVPAKGTCTASRGTGTAVLLHGNVLGDGVTFLDGEVLYDGDKIVCAACDCGTSAGYTQSTRLECGGAAISPGLINAHDHLNYNDRWPLASTAAGGERFEHRHGWRGKVKTPSNTYGTGATSAGMRWNELRQLMSGTTSMVASTKANGLVRNLDEPEAPDTAAGLQPLDYQVFLLGDSNEQFKSNCGWSYGKSEYNVSLLHGMVTHTAEGINDYAHEEFRCQSRSTQGGQNFTETNVAHIHAIGLRGSDYFRMAESKAKLIWSPRSNVALYGTTAEAPTMARLGGVVALGTDWTYSGSATMPREMACAAQLSDAHYSHYFSSEAIWQMGTKNAAIATGSTALLGALSPSKLADIAVFHAAPGALHEAVIQSTTRDVALVVRGGQVMFGEQELVRALSAGAACDPVDVCGQAKEVCASRDLGGATYAQIAAAVKDGSTDAARAYPAVFCGPPPEEPSCAPSRPGQYAGIIAEDSDGDGVTNGADNCPTMFNPLRAMDKGVQGDSDGDGLGDICDTTPIAADIDGDGVANASDNCVYDANTGQGDSDADGKGDTCDACPQLPNTSSICGPSPSRVVDVRTGVVPAGALVVLRSVVVTATDSRGAMVQDSSVLDGRFAGIYAYTARATGLSVGDIVDVTGTTTEFNGQSEITSASLSKTGVSTTPLAPIDVSVDDANSEDFEGVLVRVSGLAESQPYDCAVDHASCKDADLWQADGRVLVSNQFYKGSLFPQAARDVSGVIFYRYNRWRLCPRSDRDVVAP